MEIFLTGLIIITLLVDCYSFKQIKGGLSAFDENSSQEDVGWVFCNFISCILIGGIFTIIVHYTLGFGFITDEGLVFDLGQDMATFFTLGGFIWIVNMVVMAIVVNCCLEGYIEYKKGCLRLGVDLKDHINKFFVITNKTCRGVQEYDGLRADIEVNLQKIMYNKTWLGTYPYMSNVTTLVTLPEVKLQKDIISEYVQEYFNARGQYQVDGTELKVLGSNNDLDVIIIK